MVKYSFFCVQRYKIFSETTKYFASLLLFFVRLNVLRKKKAAAGIHIRAAARISFTITNSFYKKTNY